MKKICAFCGIVIFILACASTSTDIVPTMGEQNTKGHWTVRPTDTAVVIIGVSSPMRKQDDAIAAAKEDAAKKAAMYYDVYGRIETPHSEGGSFFDRINNSRIQVVYDKNYKKYIEQLTYDPNNDVLIAKEAIYIRFKLAASAKRVKYTTKFDSAGRPVWLNNRQLPKVDGFITEVGYAAKHQQLKDAIYKATESAVARIVETGLTIITAQVVAGSDGGSSKSVGYSVSEGRLKEFHVIEFWIDPKTKEVYTLAIGKLVK